MSEDISPSSMPFKMRMREYREGLRDSGSINLQTAYTTHEYVDLAKRILLEHRVREFTAADVVALTAIMEGRDREIQLLARTSKEEA